MITKIMIFFNDGNSKPISIKRLNDERIVLQHDGKYFAYKGLNMSLLGIVGDLMGFVLSFVFPNADPIRPKNDNFLYRSHKAIQLSYFCGLKYKNALEAPGCMI
jgi:hypothetical protein